MNIGIDIDDTITDTFDYVMPYIAEYFNVDVSYLKENNISYPNLLDKWKDKELDFAKKYLDKVIIDTPTKENVAEYINKIKEDGHRVVIITARNTHLYTDPYKTTSEQLNKANILYDKLICSFDKAKACMEEKIDLMIDDSIKNCKAVSEIGTEVLLFDGKSNLNQRSDFKRVYSWKEVYDYIVEKLEN